MPILFLMTQLKRVQVQTSRSFQAFSTKREGFTLIEILIVLAILGAMVSVAGPILFNREESPKKVFREFSALGKQMRNNAKIFGRPYRLVISFEDQTYWVEGSNSSTLIDLAKLEQQEKDKKDKKDKPEEVKSDFSLDSKFFKKPRKLNSQFEFVLVENKNSKEPVTSDLAYVYMSPDGLFETSIIQIKNKKNNVIWSLTFHPLTAQSTIIESAKTLKELER